MAKFKVNRTFTLGDGQFVISGEIIEGKIDKGMYLAYKYADDKPIKFPIRDVNFLDGKKDGEVVSETALYIDAMGVLQKLYAQLPLKDKILEVKSANSLSLSSKPHFSFRITSYDPHEDELNTKCLNVSGKIVPGLPYVFSINDTDEQFGAFYIKKHDEYFKFCVLDNTPPKFKAGNTIEHQGIGLSKRSYHYED